MIIASSVSYTFALTNIKLNAPNKNSSSSLSTIFLLSFWCNVDLLCSFLAVLDVNFVLCVVVFYWMCSWSWSWTMKELESKQTKKNYATHWYRTEVVVFCCIDRCMIIIRPTNRKRVQTQTKPSSCWVRCVAVSHNTHSHTQQMLLCNCKQKKFICYFVAKMQSKTNNYMHFTICIANKTDADFTPEINQSLSFIFA